MRYHDTRCNKYMPDEHDGHGALIAGRTTSTDQVPAQKKSWLPGLDSNRATLRLTADEDKILSALSGVACKKIFASFFLAFLGTSPIESSWPSTGGFPLPTRARIRLTRVGSPRLASLFSKRFSVLAGLLENTFEDLKLFGVGIGKYSSDFRRMLAEDWNNQVFTAFCKSDDSYPSIVRAFHSGDQSFFEQAIDRHADGPGSEVDFGPDRVHRQRALMQKCLKHAEVRVGNARLLDSSAQIVGGRLVGFPPNEPAMHRV
jgi:hypothetical protein